MEEIRLLAPCGMLGYGFPKQSFLKGLEKKPDVIAVDAGSTDAGPHKLGAGVPSVSQRAVKKDLEIILTGGYQQGIPIIIGSAGGAGAKEHVWWTLDIIQEIIREHRLSFKTAVIYADIEKDLIFDKLKSGQVNPLGPAPELSEESLDATIRIVGQMGHEPVIDALNHGAQLIVAGRAFDPAVFAALPIKLGYDPGLAVHLGKIMECGALCADPGTAKDSVMGYLRKDHFIIESLNPERKCVHTSVAAHTLYEKDHPYLLHGPGLTLDLSNCRFEQFSENSVKVSGSKLIAPDKYAVKLEGASLAAYRTIVLAGIRDPIIIENIDEVQKGVIEEVRSYYDEIPTSEYKIIFHAYGKNGVMGALEPLSASAHELGLLIDVLGPTQELADAICATVRSIILHYPVPGRKSTAGNLAFPFSPTDISCGPVYKFSIYHLIGVDDPCELFRTEYLDVNWREITDLYKS